MSASLIRVANLRCSQIVCVGSIVRWTVALLPSRFTTARITLRCPTPSGAGRDPPSRPALLCAVVQNHRGSREIPWAERTYPTPITTTGCPSRTLFEWEQPASYRPLRNIGAEDGVRFCRLPFRKMTPGSGCSSAVPTPSVPTLTGRGAVNRHPLIGSFGSKSTRPLPPWQSARGELHGASPVWGRPYGIR